MRISVNGAPRTPKTANLKPKAQSRSETDQRVRKTPLHRSRGPPGGLRRASSAAGGTRGTGAAPGRVPPLHRAAQDLSIDGLAAPLDPRNRSPAGTPQHPQILPRSQLQELEFPVPSVQLPAKQIAD